MAIALKTLDDLGWPTYVDHWAKRCATARGVAAVRGFVMFGDGGEGSGGIAAARERASEITEARGLAARDARLPLGGISDVAAAIGRVRKAAALEAAELVAVASTGQALGRLRVHLREHEAAAHRLAARGAAIADLEIGRASCRERV